jgi:polar amino acid transport system permease protein
MSLKLDFGILAKPEVTTQILSGVVTMLELTALAWVLAMVVGTVLATLRMSGNRWAEGFVSTYVEVHQNVPMLVQIFLWYFGVPALLPPGLQLWVNAHHSEFLFAFIAVGLCMGAYMSEDLRGGIRSIPKSQLEASRALGLSYLQATRLVVLPQAARIALPPLVNHTVLLFKNTSLAMTIGVAELTYAAREIESQSFRTVEIYLLATAVYLGISLLIMTGGSLLEGRFRLKTR